MRAAPASVVSAFALSVAMVGGLQAQVQSEPTSVDDSANVETELEEIIIRGQQGPRWGDLRAEIERAQGVLFARFNEINSTDDFDITCRGYMGSTYGELCLSNSARAFQNRIGTAVFAANFGDPEFRGSSSLAALLIRQAAVRERQLNDEMQRLAKTDEQLKQAVGNLGQAQTAYQLSVGNRTLSRQVSATLGELPYGAERLFEVIMGNQPWQHRLTRHKFTIADVFGEIRKLGVECAEGRERIDYEIGVDWTVPSDRSACVLQVNAKKGTTFRLYEF